MLLYALSILVSAFLLFQVQPVIARIILPWFGGSAAVWTTCLMFFQLDLLLGYLYAHALVRLRPRAQMLTHLALLLASAALLPIHPSAAWKPTASDEPILRILAMLAATVGLPYFVLSATGPLLQAWYARRGAGASSYRLYALSNAGSVFALWSYPVLFEPVFSAHRQAGIWSSTYAVFLVLCGLTAIRSARIPEARAEMESADTPKPAPRLYLMWLLLPACASTLLLAVTNHLNQNVAPIPLLWILPLSAYLLSFILCFGNLRWYRRTPYFLLLAAALAAMAYCSLSETAYYEMPVRTGIAVFVAGLFVCCMVCHGELARLKPPARYLTHFYLTIAAGGALGGLFVGLVAPLLFNAYYELSLGLLATAALAVVAARAHRDRAWQRHLLPASRCLPALAAFAAAGYAAYPMQRWIASPARAAVERLHWKPADGFDRWVVERAILIGAVLTLVALRGDWKFRWTRRAGRWAAFCIELGALLLAGYIGYQTRYLTSGAQLMVRNFYGALRVHNSGPPSDWTATRSLTVGIINHGEQFLNPARRDSPTTYFGPSSGIGLAIRAKQITGPIRVGVIGLGVGTIAAYGREGDDYRFYELNPIVVRLSAPDPPTAPPQFTFLADCKALHDVVTGDGRLSLERESPQRFDVLAIDAFSSEAVPIHLLTHEALILYFRHLKPDGILAVNISNRFVDLAPVVDGEARAMSKIDCVVESDDDDPQDLLAAKWMLITSPAAGFGQLILDKSAVVPPARNIRLWTDDYSNLFQIVK